MPRKPIKRKCLVCREHARTHHQHRVQVADARVFPPELASQRLGLLTAGGYSACSEALLVTLANICAGSTAMLQRLGNRSTNL